MKQVNSFLALLLVLLSACHSDEKESSGYLLEFLHSPTVSGPPTSYTPINFSIYKTQPDYFNNTNAVVTGKTDPSTGTYFIPADKLEKGTLYAIDWYSDDYTISNWAPTEKTGAYLTPSIFAYTDNDPTFGFPYIGNYATDGGAREVFLNGNDNETHWTAIGALRAGSSVWESLTENEKYIHLTLKKDKKGIYIEKDESGQENTTSFYFIPEKETIMRIAEGDIGTIRRTEETNIIIVAPANRSYTYTLKRD
jgi:hypothetical protein